MARYCPGDRGQCFRTAFHYIAPARSVDVHVDKAWNRGLLGRQNFQGSNGQAHSLAGPDSFDYAIANQDSCINDFCCGS